MPLTSMKLEPRESKDPCECLVSPARDEYPWGLRIHLDTEQLEALGIKGLPEVGAELELTAIVKVVNASCSASEGEKKEHRSVGLQITDMQMSAPAPKKSTASVLYGDEK